MFASYKCWFETLSGVYYKGQLVGIEPNPGPCQNVNLCDQGTIDA